MNSTKRNGAAISTRDTESDVMEWLGGEAFVAGFPAPQTCPTTLDPSGVEEAATDWHVL